MHPSRFLSRAATARTPLIKFLGKRNPPKTPPSAESPVTEPHPHPESPTGSLPDSFMSYRSKAQQHGPLGGHNRRVPPPASGGSPPSSASSSSHAYGAIGGHSGHELGSIQPQKGEVMDRSELPKRFRALAWTEEELEAVEMGGAGLPTGWGSS